MMQTLRGYTLSPIGLLNLVLAFVSLIGGCEAQGIGSNMEMFIAFTVTVPIFGSCFCCFFGCFILSICYCIYDKSCPLRRNLETIFNRRGQDQVNQPYLATNVQPYSEQTYIPPTETMSDSEPVSLPEATLHQGNAPPGYEEAIGMKTIDLPNQ